MVVKEKENVGLKVGEKWEAWIDEPRNQAITKSTHQALTDPIA
jgi:hypothetical protein